MFIQQAFLEPLYLHFFNTVLHYSRLDHIFLCHILLHGITLHILYHIIEPLEEPLMPPPVGAFGPRPPSEAGPPTQVAGYSAPLGGSPFRSLRV